MTVIKASRIQKGGFLDEMSRLADQGCSRGTHEFHIEESDVGPFVKEIYKYNDVRSPFHIERELRAGQIRSFGYSIKVR